MILFPWLIELRTSAHLTVCVVSSHQSAVHPKCCTISSFKRHFLEMPGERIKCIGTTRCKEGLLKEMPYMLCVKSDSFFFSFLQGTPDKGQQVRNVSWCIIVHFIGIFSGINLKPSKHYKAIIFTHTPLVHKGHYSFPAYCPLGYSDMTSRLWPIAVASGTDKRDKHKLSPWSSGTGQATRVTPN